MVNRTWPSLRRTQLPALLSPNSWPRLRSTQQVGHGTTVLTRLTRLERPCAIIVCFRKATKAIRDRDCVKTRELVGR